MARNKKNKEAQPKRTLRINFSEGEPVDLEIEFAVTLDIKAPMIALEQLDSGKYRLVYDKKLISDFTKVENFEMIREN